MKNKIILSLVIFITSFTVYSQSRQNRSNLTFTKKSEKLTEATGWALNKQTGKWVDNNNVIDKTICKSYWVSHISQNFKSIETASIEYNGETYYVILFEKQSGSYKYPNIQEDWEPHKQTDFFIINQNDFNTIQNILKQKDGKDYLISSKLHDNINNRFVILGGEHLYNYDNLMAKITITLEKGGILEQCMMINSQVVDGKEVVRFRMPEYCSLAKYAKDEYFECSLTEFSKIMDLK